MLHLVNCDKQKGQFAQLKILKKSKFKILNNYTQKQFFNFLIKFRPLNHLNVPDV